MRSILKIFAQDPFGPLQRMMQYVRDCAALVPDLFEALADGDLQKIEQTSSRISKLENEVDMIKNSIRDNLPKSVFLPVARRDLLDVVAKMDDIPDIAEDIGRLLTIRTWEYPPPLRAKMLEFARTCVECVRVAYGVIDALDDLVEAGFKGPATRRFLQIIDRVGTLENDSDIQQTELTNSLFDMEGEMSPVSLMMWHRLVLKVGNLANAAETMSNRLRMFIYK